MVKLRRRKGATLGFAIALAFALVSICVAVFFICMYFGGEREAKNAADAGALNVGRKAPTLNVQIQGGDEQQFTDVADSPNNADPADGGTNVNMKNINRIWGKALLCALNSHAMGDGSDHAQRLHDAANDLSDRLAQALSDPNNAKQWYLDFAQANSTKMLGKNSYLAAPDLSGWTQSFLDGDSESNIIIDSSQLPLTNDIPITMVKNSKDPTHSFLAGYHDYSVDNLDYWQVPFRLGERPHLVSRTGYDAALAKPPTWEARPVPNSFCTVGSTQDNEDRGQIAYSWAQSNPQQTYPAAIPNGFIRIKIDANTLDWEPNGLPYYTDTYGFIEDDIMSDPFALACGTLSAEEIVGDEYILGPNLFVAMFALPPIPPVMDSQAFDNIYQRVQQMHPGYSKTKLIAKLLATSISTDASDQEFVIYNSSFDVTNYDIVISTLSDAPSRVQGQPDGTPSEVDHEYFPFGPNEGWTYLSCYGEYEYPSYTEENGSRTWTPGTGYGGCLGALEVHRTTSVYYFGLCACP